MGSEEPAEHGITEKEEAPLLVPTTPTNAMITATRKAAATHPSFFSPQKRKRDASPLEIPETPWRLQQPASHDDDDGDDDDNEKVGELTAENEVVASGQVSPRSNKLASQLSDLNLSGKLAGPCLLAQDLEVAMTLEEEPPAAKKVKRRGRPANGKKATIITGGNGDAIGEDLAAVPKRKGKGALNFNEENADGNGKEAVNGDTRRRLRSPPLPVIMDSDISVNGTTAVVDESDEVDSDDPNQLGIGYKPTLMQRHARDRKRMQQVTYVPRRSPFSCRFFFFFAEPMVQIKEYKARVSREAREKRSETRRSRRNFSARYVTPAAGGTQNAEEGEKRKVVHFNLQPVVLDPMPEDAVVPEVSTMPD